MGLKISKAEIQTSQAVTLLLDGEIDNNSSVALDKEISLMVGGPGNAVILDMEKVTFISSSGIGVIVKAQNMLKATGAELTMISLQPQVKRVFEIMQLTPLLNVFESREELDEYLLKIQNRIIEKGTSIYTEQ
jgi:anti-sigma B factor antagonist